MPASIRVLFALLLITAIGCTPSRGRGGGGDDDDAVGDDDDAADDDDAVGDDDDAVGDDDDAAGGTMQVTGLDGTLSLQAIFITVEAENSATGYAADLLVGYESVSCAAYRGYWAVNEDLYAQLQSEEIDYDQYFDALAEAAEDAGFFPGWAAYVQFGDMPDAQTADELFSAAGLSELVLSTDGEPLYGDYDVAGYANATGVPSIQISSATGGLAGTISVDMSYEDQVTGEDFGDRTVSMTFDAPLCDLNQ